MTLQEAIKTGLPFKRPSYPGLIQVDKTDGALFWAEHEDKAIEGTPVAISAAAVTADDWVNSPFTSSTELEYKADMQDVEDSLRLLEMRIESSKNILEAQLERLNALMFSMNEKMRVIDERLEKSELVFDKPPISGAV